MATAVASLNLGQGKRAHVYHQPDAEAADGGAGMTNNYENFPRTTWDAKNKWSEHYGPYEVCRLVDDPEARIIPGPFSRHVAERLVAEIAWAEGVTAFLAVFLEGLDDPFVPFLVEPPDTTRFPRGKGAFALQHRKVTSKTPGSPCGPWRLSEWGNRAFFDTFEEARVELAKKARFKGCNLAWQVAFLGRPILRLESDGYWTETPIQPRHLLMAARTSQVAFQRGQAVPRRAGIFGGTGRGRKDYVIGPVAR